MAAEVTKKLFNVDEYLSMAEAGIIGPEERLELVEGEIIQMSPADTSLSYDRNIKIPLYAAAGIPEVWIQYIKKDLLLVCRDPHRNSYATFLEMRRDEFVSPVAFPKIRFSIDDLFGGPIVE